MGLSPTSPMSELIVCHFSHPPFSDSQQNQLHGVFWDLARVGLGHCGSKAGLRYRQFSSESHLLSSGATRDCNISLPVTKMALFDLLTEHTFLPIVTTPGAVWLDPSLRSHLSGISQLNFVVHAWPLLVIILVSCAYAGVIAWLMERLKNPQEFPRPFLRGFWEGCWWAFITMTTVGYGDRSPKTICGRLFAFLWICFGLVITSMFTAGITTALGQSSQSLDDSKLFQANMTVVNGSYEEIIAYEMGSSPIVVQSWSELVRDSSLQHSSDSSFDVRQSTSRNASHGDAGSEAARHYGALIEHFMYLHMRQEHPASVLNIKLQMVIKRPSVRGLLTKLEPSVTNCLISWLVTKQHRVLVDLVGLQHKGSEAEFDDPKSPEGIARSLFFTNQLHLLVLAFAFVLLFTALLCWEKFWWKPRNPDYQFIEHNWKYERQKKEAEFTQQLDFKAYYKRRKSSNSSISPPAGTSRAVAGGSESRQQQLRSIRQMQQQQQQRQQNVADILESEASLLFTDASVSLRNGWQSRRSPPPPPPPPPASPSVFSTGSMAEESISAFSKEAALV